MNITQATPSTVAKRFMNRAHCRCEVAHNAPITIGTKMKWVKYVSEATLSHHWMVDLQKCCCNTVFGS